MQEASSEYLGGSGGKAVGIWRCLEASSGCLEVQEASSEYLHVRVVKLEQAVCIWRCWSVS